MRFVDVIRAKRDGAALSPDDIRAFVAGATDGSIPDYQVSALLMAILLRGMTADETAWLTGAMIASGTRLDLSDIPGVKVDKHSTGGVGDKTSLVLAPLVAACGAVVPMMSGRGLGHTGGTLDKLESIPGFRVDLSLDEIRRSLKTVGCVLVGQTAEIAPADRVLYALRDVTGTVESIPLITASIMSKKIAEGISALVLDVKAGRGAFMKSDADARRLAEALVEAGRAAGVRTEALITGMDVPLGRTVGNAIEVVECTEMLKGRGASDLKHLSALLAARMLVMAGIASDEVDGERRVLDALASGRALEKWREIIANQGGDPHVVDEYRLLPIAPLRHIVTAPRSGFLTTLDAELIGRATVALGAGRGRVEDAVDPAVGADILAKPGARLSAGDPLVVFHYRREADLKNAVDLAVQAIRIEDEPLSPIPLVRGRVSG
jgi:pyrimidine-nucleoside phosphorylase